MAGEAHSNLKTVLLVIGSIVGVVGLVFTIYTYRQDQAQKHQSQHETVRVSLIPSSQSYSDLMDSSTLVTITGFEPGEKVRVSWNGISIGELYVQSMLTTTNIQIDKKTAPGSYVVKVEGLSSGKFGSATYIIRPQ